MGTEIFEYIGILGGRVAPGDIYRSRQMVPSWTNNELSGPNSIPTLMECGLHLETAVGIKEADIPSSAIIK
jgi:hypothetical protein